MVVDEYWVLDVYEGLPFDMAVAGCWAVAIDGHAFCIMMMMIQLLE